jgi:transcriptional regulator with XRE-family HTH domain
LEADVLALSQRIGARIAELRTAKRWTQEQFAERLGCSLKYAQRLEAGKANLTLGSIVKLSKVLGMKPAALFILPRKGRRKGVGRPRKQAST